MIKNPLASLQRNGFFLTKSQQQHTIGNWHWIKGTLKNLILVTVAPLPITIDSTSIYF